MLVIHEITIGIERRPDVSSTGGRSLGFPNFETR